MLDVIIKDATYVVEVKHFYEVSTDKNGNFNETFSYYVI